MSGPVGAPSLVHRPRNINYSRPAIRVAGGYAAHPATASSEQGYEDRSVEAYQHDGAEDDTGDDEDEGGEDADEDYKLTLHPPERASFDSAYASETGGRPFKSSDPIQPHRGQHIVHLHRQPQPGGILKASKQRDDPHAARNPTYPPDSAPATSASRPRVVISQPPRPMSQTSAYRPVSALSSASTASDDTITPANYRKHMRLSAAALKPIDLSRSISSNRPAPAASPSLAPLPRPPTSHSGTASAHPASPTSAPAARSSPRGPAVVMFTEFSDEEQESRNTVSRRSGSEAGGDGAEMEGPPWQISDADYSGLSEKQLQKLRKKGINPALYVEMQAARKKAGRIGILSGHTFLN